MAEVTLEAQKRTVTGKQVNQLRAQGIVPINLYGPKTAPVNLQVAYRPLEIALMKAGGNSLLELIVDGKSTTVLAREVQRNTIKRTITHVDFFAVDLESEVTADIPVHFVGVSPAVDARLGILVTGTNSITISTLPGNLIQQIEVDLSVLTEAGSSITVADLKLGEGIRILNNPEEMIASIAQTGAGRAEAELEAAETEEAVSSSEPEVIRKGKEDEEGED